MARRGAPTSPHNYGSAGRLRRIVLMTRRGADRDNDEVGRHRREGRGQDLQGEAQRGNDSCHHCH